MAILSNKFRQRLRKYNINIQNDAVKMHINLAKYGDKLDYAQKKLDEQVWEDVQKYMPRDTGTFISETNALNVVTSGKVYLYPPESPQGHYLYEGRTMIDPVTGSPWARKGVRKVYVADYDGDKEITTPEYLTYQNPYATDHWGETAIKNHKRDWAKVVKRALKS